MTTPSWSRMPSSRCETLVLPFVPVVANSSGSGSSGAGAVDPGAQIAEHGAGVVDDEDREARVRGDLGARGIRDDRDGALLGGAASELGAVAVDAPDRDERLAGAEVGGGEGDARQGDTAHLAAHLAGESGGEFGQLTPGRVRGAEHGRQARLLFNRHVPSMISWRRRDPRVRHVRPTTAVRRVRPHRTRVRLIPRLRALT